MKKRSEAYPFYDRDEDIPESAVIPLTDQAFDSLLTTDRLEIDRIRWGLERCLDDTLPRRFEDIPAIRWIGRAIEKKLCDTGFAKKTISDPQALCGLTQVMQSEQWANCNGRTPEGFPKKSFCHSDDKRQIWILEDIEAALLALWAYQRLKVAFDAPGDHPAAICSLTFQFLLNAERSGVLRKVALAGKRQTRTQRDKQTKRQTWKGTSVGDRERRNDELCNSFKKWIEKGKPANSFYQNKAKKYDVSPSTIRKIVNP